MYVVAEWDSWDAVQRDAPRTVRTFATAGEAERAYSESDCPIVDRNTADAVRSPFVRRALAGELPAKVTR